ncbi:MAG: NAD(P)H-dependent glycerol-3-phosphate dehydrogenase [Clostridia bacterium]|nr:NAD(P)H-dependent glycerol-3-phosphate dehydrogenase [Clostridia bacterium]
MRIAVIGSGSWGCALCAVLAEKGHDVCLWSYFPEESKMLEKDRENKKNLPGLILPENVTYTSDLKTAAEGTELFVIVTPSSTVGATAKGLSPFVKEGAIMVCASKGFDPESKKMLTETIKMHIPQATVAALSGPSHAEEVAKKLPTTLVAACENQETAYFLQDLFMTDYLRIYAGDDVIGVELGGALKNIIALCAGVSDGLGFGDNTKAALMTRGMTEMARLGLAMGAKLSTFSGLSGMGDLIVTCTSMHSRNRRAGILLGQGKTAEEAQKEVGMVVEGVYAAKEAYEIAKKLGVEMPITQQAYRLLFEGATAKEAVEALMNREKRHESDNGFVINEGKDTE